MANFGDATFNVSADTSEALKSLGELEKRFEALGGVLAKAGEDLETGLSVPVSKVQKQLEEMGRTVTQTGTGMSVVFNRVAGLVDALNQPLNAARTEWELLNKIGARTREALSLTGVEKELTELGTTIRNSVVHGLEDLEAIAARIPSLLTRVSQAAKFLQEDLVDPETGALIAEKGSFVRQPRELERVPQFDDVSELGTVLERELLKAAVAGRNLDGVLSQISRRVSDIDSLARTFSQLPGDAPRVEIARLDTEMQNLIGRATKVTEEMAKIGEGTTSQGQLFDAEGLDQLEEIELSAIRSLNQELVNTAANATKSGEALKNVTQLTLDFGNSQKTVAASAAEAAAGTNTLKQATDALSKEVRELDAEFQRLRELTARGSVDPKVPERMREVTGRAKELGVQLGLTQRQLNRVGGQEGGGKVAEFLRNLSGSFDDFGQSIEDATGIAESDFAILLGAGLAGGFAGVLRIANKVVRVVAEMVDEFTKLNTQVELTFRGNAEFVRNFADGATAAFGVSRREALETANAFAALGRQLRFNEDDLLDFSVQMTKVAAVVEQSIPGFTETAQAQQAVEEAVKGSTDALLALGVTTEDLNKISLDTFGKLFDQLSENQQILVSTEAVVQSAGEALLAAGEQVASFGDHIKNAKDAVVEFFAATEEKRFNKAVEFMEALNGFFDFLDPTIDAIRAKLRGLGEESLLQARQMALVVIEDKEEREEVVKVIDEELKRLRDKAALLDSEKATTEEIAEARERDLKAFRGSKELQRQAQDAQRAVAEATLDGIRRIEDAEIRLQRTREDNARKLRDLLIKNARAIEDAATRVEAAELELIDNQNDAQDRLEDAIDRLADAKLQSERELRDINERIEDTERDHARRVRDSQEAIAEAREEASARSVESLIAMQQALRRGDLEAFNVAARQEEGGKTAADVAKLQRDLSEEQEDFEREVARLRRDRDEARLDGIKEIKRAERDRTRAERDNLVLLQKAQLQLNQAKREQVRAQDDAIRSLNDLEVEQNRALRDAKRALEEAEIARERAVASAIRAFEKLSEKIGLTVDDIIAELIRLRQFPVGLSLISGSVTVTGPDGQPLGRAHGGPAYSNNLYTVGERGPELFLPSKDGYVFPNDVYEALKLLVEQGRGASSTPSRGGSTFIINESVNAHATAMAVASLLVKGVG